ncbi:hypothetical protein JCM18899A_18780 [Nocardioides sp. AN3]
MSEQDIWDALAALLEAGELSGLVFDYGTVPGEAGVPGSLPDFYAILSVERRPVPSSKANGADRAGWRATVRYVDKTTANARLVGYWVRVAFESTIGHGKRLSIGGVESTPLTHETTQPVGPDKGRFSGSVTYTFAT